MKCEQISELLPDYLQGSLSPDQLHTVEAHLEQCADCSEETALWQKLSLLPVDQPGPEPRARFEAMFQPYQAGRSNQPHGRLACRARMGAWRLSMLSVATAGSRRCTRELWTLCSKTNRRSCRWP